MYTNKWLTITQGKRHRHRTFPLHLERAMDWKRMKDIERNNILWSCVNGCLIHSIKFLWITDEFSEWSEISESQAVFFPREILGLLPLEGSLWRIPSPWFGLVRLVMCTWPGNVHSILPPMIFTSCTLRPHLLFTWKCLVYSTDHLFSLEQPNHTNLGWKKY